MHSNGDPPFRTVARSRAELRVRLSGQPAGQDVRIEVVGELISKPYIEITLNLMRCFGVEVERQEWQGFTIRAGQKYTSPGEIHVEGDASSASYFLAAGAMIGTPGCGPCSPLPSTNGWPPTPV